MLILTRKPGTRIMIGSDIIVEVLGVEHGRVRIGITAPESVRVDREEIYEKRQAEQRAAL